jgi:hypothetical protein
MEGGGKFRFNFSNSVTDAHRRSRDAARVRDFASALAPSRKEGAGKAGCALHPRSRATCTKKRARAYRFSGGTPAFPARWFYGFLRALLGDRAFLSPSPARSLASHELDASVGASGPHDFAVRARLCSSFASHARPPHPTARFVTLRNAPLVGETRRVRSVICPTEPAEYFSAEGWTGRTRARWK